jgi:Lon protease-like protein
MADQQPEPITNQEIPVMADRVARALVADMLAECRIYLGDLIDEEIGDDPDGVRLDPHTHGHVYGLVWDQLGRAAADYQHREQVLAEAAELDAARAENDRLRQQLAQVAALLPADPADDINAPWTPARQIRAALAARTQPAT